jgi:anionic cell wall polymer biosynthesis LytR-Cps2A-Psr (LCP) family protein
MLRSLYRTLFTYTIFRKYFATIFVIFLGVVSIVEISFFYSDIFELNKVENLSLFLQLLFSLKWVLIFGFSIYFFYSFYTFKPQKTVAKKVIQKEKTVKTEKELQPLTAKTEAKLDRLLHKKKLQTKADKLIG